jgi:hypothetical protein
MSTPKQVAANRRNAEKSTGPKTARGKSRTRLNALKQGSHANLSVLPGEDAELYQGRLDAWTGHLAPLGPVEHYLVQRAVQISWQLDRADRCQVARLTHEARATADVDAAETSAGADRLAFDPSDSGERLRKHQHACGRMLIRTLDAFARLHFNSTEALREADGTDLTEARDQAVGAVAAPAANPQAGAGEVEEVSSSSQPENAHGLIEEILAGILARSPQVESPSTPAAPIGLRAASWPASDETGNEPTAVDGRPDPRVEPTRAERRELRIGQRSSHFPRRADRDASHGAWPGPRDMDARQPTVTNSMNAAARRPSQDPESSPNEPALRRRVGGYEVPLDSRAPATGADRTPVRLRRRCTRDVRATAPGCMPA